MTELHFQSAAAIARGVADGQWSVREVVDHHIRRIETTHAALNAVVWPRFEQARADADAADEACSRGDALGPLHGVPVTIKDQFAVAGMPTTCGVARLRANIDAADGAMTAALRRAGAIVIGKTNVPQALSALETDNALFGRTNNPWDLTRTPGGSSGGEAAAVAAGCSALGLGGDFGGSTRVPAAWCGVYGLRPTARRLPLDPLPITTAGGREGIVAQPAPLARHATDLALAMKVMIESMASSSMTLVPPVPWRDPGAVAIAGLRVALLPQVGAWPPTAAVRRALGEAADTLARQGALVEPWADAPPTQDGVDLFFGILGAERLSFLRDLLGNESPVPLVRLSRQLTSIPAPLLSMAAALLRLTGQERMHHVVSKLAAPTKSADGLMRLLYRRFDYETRFVDAMARGRYDALLCPALPIAAPPHGTVNDMADFWGSALLFNSLGLPAGVAPVTRVRAGEQGRRAVGRDKAVRAVAAAEQGSAGLPVAVQVAAPPWREDIVLALLMALERGCASAPDFPSEPPL
ncbi:MAG: amidase family protein [Burkholderiaceae bacterium]